MSIEEKFNAAVNVIRSLPKNGSFQPSHELMLRFYAYYKQATEGPPTSGRPGFWDIVGRAKYDAWARLGKMTSTAAMEAYVDELNKIVETMAYTDNVADFLKSLDSFYARVPPDVLETCIGPALEKIRSSPNSPLASREGTPAKKAIANGIAKGPLANGVKAGAVDMDDSSPNGNSSAESEDEDFLDSIEVLPEGRMRNAHQTVVVANGHHTSSEVSSQKGEPLDEILLRTITTLRKEVSQLNESVSRLEGKQNLVSKQYKMLFGSMSKETVAFVVGWPIIVHFGLNWLLKKQRNTH